MAQYKVPQDVEADDKLLGPFNFRQFVYLLIAGGLTALAVGLFQLFPLLAIIPVPFILFLGALALPLKKDQPMETYLAAIVSYYLKPHVRLWIPGQKESPILITAPKKVEEERVRNITGEEATHRLSFLADIVDTEGYAIKGIGMNQVKNELVEEANTLDDMFETSHFDSLESAISRDENARHNEVIREMREQIEKNNIGQMDKEIEKVELPNYNSSVVVNPVEKPVEKNNGASQEDNSKKEATSAAKPSIIELASNTDYSIATIEKEANRINRKEEGEVFISLH